MELFFEVNRGKQHIMIDVAESASALDIKQVISGLIQKPVSEITLKRPTNESQTKWETIESEKPLLEVGYTQKTAKPDDPAILAYTLPEDNGLVSIEPVSTPPELHDAMQAAPEY